VFHSYVAIARPVIYAGEVYGSDFCCFEEFFIDLINMVFLTSRIEIL